MHCCCDTFLLFQMMSVLLVLSHVAAQTSIVCVLCAFGSQTSAHCVLGVLISLSCPLAIGSLSLEGVTRSEQGLTSTSAPPASTSPDCFPLAPPCGCFVSLQCVWLCVDFRARYPNSSGTSHDRWLMFAITECLPYWNTLCIVLRLAYCKWFSC